MKKVQPMPLTLENMIARTKSGDATILLNSKEAKVFHVEFGDQENEGVVVRVWPWRLAIENDLGTYEFARHMDMMEFFRDKNLGAWVNGVLDQDLPEALAVMAHMKFEPNENALSAYIEGHPDMPNRHFLRACAQVVKAVEAFDNQVTFRCLAGRSLPSRSQSLNFG